jgi:hypothetical protein
MTKTLDGYFADWEGSAFGFGYGSGEEHVLPAVKTFFACVSVDGDPRGYDYRVLEREMTPTVAWLLINRFCAFDVEIIEYGTSPRHGWLTEHGDRLKAYVDSKTIDELIEVVTDHALKEAICYPDACNCGPTGYQEGVKCPNPFWPRRNP